MSKAKPLVGYVRVSTQRQGRSGLGLEAQLAAVHGYAAQHGTEVVAVFEEVESGRISERPQLAAALAHAKKVKGKLVIAKLDRLARNVAFVSAIMESGVDFVAVDNPHATRLTLHILAAVAEHEAHMISERTKAALAAAKARGVRLGSPIATDTVAAARAAKSARARQRAQNTLAIIEALERNGVVSNYAVAKALTARGVRTPQGGTAWQGSQVARLRARASAS